MKADLYYYNRAEAELRMARQALHDDAARVHYELANRYFDKFYRDKPVARRIVAEQIG